MNKLTIIGNLTRDPETRTTSTGLTVCTFTVAVNRRISAQREGMPEADFFRVSAWRQLGENCQKYLAKGRKVAVVGNVRLNTYTKADGTQGASLEVTAEDVEFLTPKSDSFTPGAYSSPASAPAPSPASGFEEVNDEELPF